MCTDTSHHTTELYASCLLALVVHKLQAHFVSIRSPSSGLLKLPQEYKPKVRHGLVLSMRLHVQL